MASTQTKARLFQVGEWVLAPARRMIAWLTEVHVSKSNYGHTSLTQPSICIAGAFPSPPDEMMLRWSELLA